MFWPLTRTRCVPMVQVLMEIAQVLAQVHSCTMNPFLFRPHLSGMRTTPIWPRHFRMVYDWTLVLGLAHHVQLITRHIATHFTMVCKTPTRNRQDLEARLSSLFEDFLRDSLERLGRLVDQPLSYFFSKDWILYLTCDANAVDVEHVRSNQHSCPKSACGQLNAFVNQCKE